MSEFTTFDGGLLERREPAYPTAVWPWRFIIFSFLLFLASLFLYFGLSAGYSTYLEKKISEADTELNQLGANVSIDDQKEFLLFYAQLLNLNEVLKNHVDAERFLVWLERATNQKVFYKNLGFDIQSRAVTLDGVTDSYETLTEQLEALNQSSEVVSYVLTQAALRDGRVNFQASVTLRPELFKP